MESRAKVLGHPVHQMLIVFPLGLLATAVLFDIGWLLLDRSDLTVVSWWRMWSPMMRSRWMRFSWAWAGLAV